MRRTIYRLSVIFMVGLMILTTLPARAAIEEPGPGDPTPTTPSPEPTTPTPEPTTPTPDPNTPTPEPTTPTPEPTTPTPEPTTPTPDPDTDGDGIADIYDDCPTEFGLSAHNGCPAPAVAPIVVPPAPIVSPGIADPVAARASVSMRRPSAEVQRLGRGAVNVLNNVPAFETSRAAPANSTLASAQTGSLNRGTVASAQASAVGQADPGSAQNLGAVSAVQSTNVSNGAVCSLLAAASPNDRSATLSLACASYADPQVTSALEALRAAQDTTGARGDLMRSLTDHAAEECNPSMADALNFLQDRCGAPASARGAASAITVSGAIQLSGGFDIGHMTSGAAGTVANTELTVISASAQARSSLNVPFVNRTGIEFPCESYCR